MAYSLFKVLQTGEMLMGSTLSWLGLGKGRQEGEILPLSRPGLFPSQNTLITHRYGARVEYSIWFRHSVSGRSISKWWCEGWGLLVGGLRHTSWLLLMGTRLQAKTIHRHLFVTHNTEMESIVSNRGLWL